MQKRSRSISSLQCCLALAAIVCSIVMSSGVDATRRILQAPATCLTAPTVILASSTYNKPSNTDLTGVIPSDKRAQLDLAAADVQVIYMDNPPACLAQATTVPKNLIIWQDINMTNAFLKAQLGQLTSVPGTLMMYGKKGVDGAASSLKDLTAFSKLQSVGSLYINNLDGLPDLTGLDGLTTVTLDLLIMGSDKLITLKGLEGLTAIGRDLLIESDLDLKSVDGIQNIVTIGGKFVVKGNGNLFDILPMTGLRSIGGNTLFVNNGDTILDLPLTYVPKDAPVQKPYELNNEHALHKSEVVVVHNSSVAPTAESVNFRIGNYVPPISDFTISHVNTRVVSVMNATGMAELQQLKGHLIIWDDGSLHSLKSLSGLTLVNGELLIVGASATTGGDAGLHLETLDGLQQLTSVGGLNLVSMQDLTGLAELSSLVEIRMHLVVLWCRKLQNLQGLENIKAVDSTAWIESNDNLVSLDGLQGLTSVGWYLYLSSNQQLTNLDGLANLRVVNGDLIIKDNYHLESTAGMQSLVHVGNAVVISWNANLADVECLSKLTNVTVDLMLNGNKKLASLAPLKSLTSIGLSCIISSSNKLVDLTGLNNVKSIGGILSIANNPNMTSLKGLDSLTSVGMDVYIRGNANLTSLDTLASHLTRIGVTDSGDLHINDNPKLATLGSLPSIITTNPRGQVFVVGNGAIPAAQLTVLQSKFAPPNAVGPANAAELAAQAVQAQVAQAQVSQAQTVEAQTVEAQDVEAQGMTVEMPDVGSNSTSTTP